MATSDQVTQAIGCLSTVFPQFVAKELAHLTDKILASVQGFTDPLAAVAELNLSDLLDDVVEISDTNTFGDLALVAGGLLKQYSQDEINDSLEYMSKEYPGATKAVQDIANVSEQVITNGIMLMSLYGDLPYASAQRMGEMIIRVNTLKIKNLECLRKHVVQISNLILVLASNVNNYKDDTFSDMEDASKFLEEVKKELTKSKRLVDGDVVFDSEAFSRAQAAMVEVSKALTPDRDGTSMLDVASILTFGSVDNAQVSVSNRAMTTLVIPALIRMIEAEVAAVVSQVSVTNFYIGKMGTLIASFQNAANTSRVGQQRIRSITDIQVRVSNLCERIDLSQARKNLRAASAEMLLWSSRTKAILVLMERVRLLSFRVGVVGGDDDSFAKEEAFQRLLSDLTSITNNVTEEGIEDTVNLSTHILSLTKGARRIIGDLADGKATPNSMATFHALVAQVANVQVGEIDDSIEVARRQTVACEAFNSLDIPVEKQLTQLTDTMRQLGMDRGADLLNSGGFEEFMSSDLDTMSYIGVTIKCLKDAIVGIDDSRTRKQVNEIRENLIGEETNLRIAALDSAAVGLTRFIDRAKEQMARIQKNAKTIESVVEQLKVIGEKIGDSVDEASIGYDFFRANMDHLFVGAGGRLADGLEEYSDHPNAGVPLCGPA